METATFSRTLFHYKKIYNLQEIRHLKRPVGRYLFEGSLNRNWPETIFYWACAVDRSLRIKVVLEYLYVSDMHPVLCFTTNVTVSFFEYPPFPMRLVFCGQYAQLPIYSVHHKMSFEVTVKFLLSFQGAIAYSILDSKQLHSTPNNHLNVNKFIQWTICFMQESMYKQKMLLQSAKYQFISITTNEQNNMQVYDGLASAVTCVQAVQQSEKFVFTTSSFQAHLYILAPLLKNLMTGIEYAFLRHEIKSNLFVSKHTTTHFQMSSSQKCSAKHLGDYDLSATNQDKSKQPIKPHNPATTFQWRLQAQMHIQGVGSLPSTDQPIAINSHAMLFFSPWICAQTNIFFHVFWPGTNLAFQSQIWWSLPGLENLYQQMQSSDHRYLHIVALQK